MKLGKYILGLALVAVGLTSCDQDNVGAIYEPSLGQDHITFITEKQSVTTEETSIEVPVAIGRSITKGDYTTTVTLTDASDGLKLKNGQSSEEVTFKNGEGLAYVTVVVEGMEKGKTYTGTLNLPFEVTATADTTLNNKQIVEEEVSVMCDYNWLSAGTCTFMDHTGSMFGLDDPMTAEKVDVQNAEGTNIYRIVEPLTRIYEQIDDPCDPTNFMFHLADDGNITVDDGTNLDWWGYLGYFDQRYAGYCNVVRDGNTYTVNQLLLDQETGDLYTGCSFTFIWNKP